MPLMPKAVDSRDVEWLWCFASVGRPRRRGVEGGRDTASRVRGGARWVTLVGTVPVWWRCPDAEDLLVLCAWSRTGTRAGQRVIFPP